MDPKSFCYMLKGFLEGKQSLSHSDIYFIKNNLHDVFEHTIDKQYPEDGGKSQDIHDGKKVSILGGRDENGNKIRC